MLTTTSSRARLWLSASCVAAAALLAACDRPADTSTSRNDRPADAVVSDVGKTAAKVGNEVRQEAREAGQAVGGKAKDLAITTEVNTLLARDDQLSALKINVDTTDGHVLLKGTAPTDAARARAADLARSVGGVLGVENKLEVQARN